MTRVRAIAFAPIVFLGIAFQVGCASPPPAGVPRPARATKRFEYTEPQMGVPFRIVLYAPDAATAATAARLAFGRIRQLNDALSDYDTDSELSRLSRTSGERRAIPVSDDLWRVLDRAQQLSAQSHGAFDVTIGPCVSLWRKARREKKLPRPEQLAEARAAVGWEKLRLDRRTRTATLAVSGMRLDLGGIAKGYAVDEALKVLRDQGIEQALVAGGGDLAVSGPPPGKAGWRVEISALDATNAPLGRHVLLAQQALATSGDVFQHIEIDGRRYSHILDPRTGQGLTDHSLVTVIARDCLTADSLATAVSVAGPGPGLKLIESTPHAAARIVRQPGASIEVYESRGFHRSMEPEVLRLKSGGPP